MRTKSNLVQTEFHPTLTSFLFQLDTLYRSWGSELIITSGSEPDSYHSVNSLHYATPCQAADIRTWRIARVPNPELQFLGLRSLADDFCEHRNIPIDWIDVVLESTHIHIEYQPKRRDLNTI